MSLFSQRRKHDDKAFSALRPGDLYGTDPSKVRQGERFVRYLLLANGSALTFFSIILARVDALSPAHKEIVTAVWLTAIGAAIAIGAWVLFQLSRRGESNALAQNVGNEDAAELPPPVQAIMRKAAIKKLMGFRVLIVSAISFCIGLFLGVKGLFLL